MCHLGVNFYPVFHNFEIRKIKKKLRINQVNNWSTIKKRLFSTLDQILGDTKRFWFQVFGSTFHFDYVLLNSLVYLEFLMI